MTKESYATIAVNPQATNLAVDPEYGINATDLFSFDALMKRYDFKMSSLEADEDAAQNAANTQAATPATTPANANG
jgi:hypothetical protein